MERGTHTVVSSKAFPKVATENFGTNARTNKATAAAYTTASGANRQNR